MRQAVNCTAKQQKRLDEALARFDGLHHDVGFMWQLTAVADHKLTGNEKSATRALHAATLLAGRYNPNGRFIRAWERNRNGWIIIDCLMNLALLYWASEKTGDPRFAQIARNHADTALQKLQRSDGSCNHIAILDTETGDLLDTPAGQGCTPGSSWSRGQAWAIYGFSISACCTGQASYLAAARRAAHYFIANTALDGWNARVDFRASDRPGLWDTTATACAACGLLTLSEISNGIEGRLYRCAAEQMIQVLLDKHCDFEPEHDGLLQNGTVAYGHLDTHVPIIYGDYFFVEALLRLHGRAFSVWR